MNLDALGVAHPDEAPISIAASLYCSVERPREAKLAGVALDRLHLVPRFGDVRRRPADETDVDRMAAGRGIAERSELPQALARHARVVDQLMVQSRLPGNA